MKTKNLFEKKKTTLISDISERLSSLNKPALLK